MTKSLFKQPLFYTSLTSLIALGLIIGAYVFGWTTPSTAPPGGNITLTSSQWITSGSNIYYNVSNVGIGTTTPSEKLEVAGNIKISGTGNGIKFPDNTIQTTAATAGGNMSWPTEVKETTATHDGNFGSYAALHSWIQSNGCAGYHVCLSWELAYAFSTLPSASLCGDGTCNGYFNSGVGDPSYSYLGDCIGWTTNSSSYGAYIWYNTAPRSGVSGYSQCISARAFLCCK